MTTSQRQEFFIIQSLIRTHGSKGKLHHLKTTTTFINNTYNDDGEEIAMTSPLYETTDVIYSSKRVTAIEQSPLSLEDSFYRFTIIFNKDMGITKSDKFEDINGLLYPIERIDRLGDRGGEIVYQLFCKRD